MKEAMHKEGKGGWGKLEATSHPRSKHRFYSEKVQRSIHEPHRRGELAEGIANKHRELAGREATRSVRTRSIRRGYEDEMKLRGISREQAQAEQSKHAKDYARVVGETEGRRAWGPPPATGRPSRGIRGGGEGGYFPPMKKASLFDAQRAFLKAGGEGSRGGHVIGHTKSGKPIYLSGSHEEWKSQHEHFTPDEHREARNVHAEAANQATGDIDANKAHSEHVRRHQTAIIDAGRAEHGRPPRRKVKKPKSFSEILQGKLDKHNKRQEENMALMREMQGKIAEKRAREGKPAHDPGAPAGAISLSDMMDVHREEKEAAKRALPPERPKKPVTPQIAAPAGSTPLGVANVELAKQREAEGGYTESGASKRKNPPKRRKDTGATAMTAGQGSLFKAQRAFVKAGAKCTGCGKSMNPADAMLGPVCLNCTKQRHAAVTGTPPKPPIQKARIVAVNGVVFVG
jgi:hypothetical protein